MSIETQYAKPWDAPQVLDNGGAIFNVKHRRFGAVGDGVADDAPAIQAAIDAAELAGGAVLIPHGNYLLSTGLTISAKGMRVQGAGKRRTYLTFGATTGTCIRVWEDGANLSGFHLTGQGKAVAGGAIGVEVHDGTGNGPKDVTLSDFEVTQFPVGLKDRGYAVKYWGLRFESCGSAIQTANQGGHTSPIGLWINACDVGVEFVGDVTHWAMYDSNIERCTVAGISAQGAAAAAKTMALYNCHFELNETRDIDMGPGVLDFSAEACRFGGLNSFTQQSIRHQGAVDGGRFRMRLRGCRFIDDAVVGATNAQIIYVGPGVDLISDSPDGQIAGCPRSAITLVDTGTDYTSRLLMPGNLGMRAINVAATGTVTLNFAIGGHQDLVLTGNTTLANPLNVVPGQLYIVTLVQDATGGRTLAFGSRWLGASSFTMPTAANARGAITALGTSTGHLFIVGTAQ